MTTLYKRTLLITLFLLALALATACGAGATPTPRPTATKAPAVSPPGRQPAEAVPTATAAPTPAATTPAKAKLERLRIVIPPGPADTNFTWLHGIGGMIDKRPALESLIGTDRNTSEFIPELAEKWEMAPDGKAWTVTLRKGARFIDSEKDWGEFAVKDVRHAVFLITQPDSVASNAGIWRSFMGIAKTDTEEVRAKKLEEGVEIADPYKVVFHTKVPGPELTRNLSSKSDLPMESKARWDAGGKGLYDKKVVGTGPLEMTERKLSVGVFYRRVENHWRTTPEYRDLEISWVPEASTRLAALLAGEAQISAVDRSLQKDATAKGMKIIQGKLPGVQSGWFFGGLYFATPDKLDPKVPWANPEKGKLVRQAMNMAINRQAIADNILGGQAEPLRVVGFNAKLDSAIWPGVYNPDWDGKFNELYGYNPSKAKQLLEQAGYANGFEFTVYLSTSPTLPEIVDIAQGLALDWQKVGLKPKLVELDLPRVRGLYQTKTIHGAVWGLGFGTNALGVMRVFNQAKDSTIYAYEHPFLERKSEDLDKTVPLADRARILREMGDHKYNEFAEMPMFWLFGNVVVNPKFVAEYVFPGDITGLYTHLEFIKLAR